MTPNPWAAGDAGGPPPRRKKPRLWRDKFREAFRGTKRGIRGHSSFYIHFFFAALVVAVAGVLQVSWVEWCLLLGCIGFVFTAELFNSAIETLFHGLDEESKKRIHGCLDIAAGAVLMASLTTAAVGSIIFIRQFAKLWG
ncbi:diacylglycerol kinase [Limnoglobus roseus]|uniref:Diacylglycerol kinase n=1 Tax=Limnoglobus roseus TaxID=2598579 RepID=A0A5C1ACZ9_9BACT|nr:diacylglycerol kinase [Limnoglobus roseus]QEL17229.1 diacylglycerol kinase [Limnoglobus roseus]